MANIKLDKLRLESSAGFHAAKNGVGRRSFRRMICSLQVERWGSKSQEKLSEEAMCKHLREQGYSTTVYKFSPGTEFPDHSHGVHKKDSIISGRFLFGMQGEEVVLEAGDMLDVPAGVVHYARVVGPDPVTFVDASKY